MELQNVLKPLEWDIKEGMGPATGYATHSVHTIEGFLLVSENRQTGECLIMNPARKGSIDRYAANLEEAKKLVWEAHVIRIGNFMRDDAIFLLAAEPEIVELANAD